MSAIKSEEFTTAGAHTWIVPDGINHCWVTMVGGGGGGERDLSGNVQVGTEEAPGRW